MRAKVKIKILCNVNGSSVMQLKAVSSEILVFSMLFLTLIGTQSFILILNSYYSLILFKENV